MATEVKSSGNVHQEKIAPIQVKSPLAGNPAGNPLFAVKIRNSKSEEIVAADPVATRALVALMDMEAVNGGAACHYGGPAAFAEIMSAVHALMFKESARAGKEWYELFNFANDAGHTENGLYALKANYGFDNLTLGDLKGFRSIDSKLTGHGESHLWPEGVLLSNGPLGSTLPQTQGLALGDGHSGKKRHTICTISDGALMEGEAKEAVTAIPGLASKGKLAPFIMLISDNNTKLSGRIDDQAYSLVPYLESLKQQGWDLRLIEDGHDLQNVYLEIEKAYEDTARDPSRPVAIWFKTLKGKGTAKTEASSSGGHGFPLKHGGEVRAFVAEIYGGEDKLPEPIRAWIKELEDKHEESQKKASTKSGGVPTSKIQVGLSKGASAMAAQGYPVFSVSADLPGSTGIGEFQAAWPSMTQDIGVAESNMISTAAGLSKVGYIPIVDTFAAFGATKGALPLTMAVLSQSPMISIFSHTGFQDAADGASHQALMYFAQLASIPHTRILFPASAEEAEYMMCETIRRFADDRKAGRHPDSTVFFLGRENFPVSLVDSKDKYSYGKPQILREAKAGAARAVALVASGSTVPQAVLAAEILEQEGIEATVVNHGYANNVDLATFRSVLQATGGNLITVEDHQKKGGVGSWLVSTLLDEGVTLNKVRTLGVDGAFGQSAYTATQLLALHGLDSKGIAETARKLLG